VNAHGAATVLVIDDTPQNLDFMSAVLRERGYRVRVARSGLGGLRSALHDPPDAVILDVRMPDIDGHEVCRRFKADPRLRAVPVLFVSAFGDAVDKVEGLAAGGVDYLTKPVDPNELAARLDTHLTLRSTRLALERRGEELAAANARLRELEAFRRQLGHMLVHDMRGHIMAILAHAELLSLDLGENAEGRVDCEGIVMNARRLTGIVGEVLDVGRLEDDQMPLQKEPSSLDDLVSEALKMLAPASLKHIEITSLRCARKVLCDRTLIQRVVINLLGNALKYGPREGPVEVGIEHAEGHARVTVRDHGPGIPEQEHAHIFELFAQASGSERRGWGIGLSFCRLAIEAHGGSIGVESVLGEGSTFWFTLPCAAATLSTS
jgi:two-component system, sensor histidine kinase and response regulator